MSPHTCELGTLHPKRGSGLRERERGIALLITLGLLVLLGAASLAVIFLTSSDTMINGYYRDYRGSFYAADSGVNIVVEAMKNAIAASANPAAAGAPLPVPGALPTTVPSFNQAASIPAGLTASYAPFQGTYYTIGDAGSWTSQFTMVANKGGVPVIGQPTFSMACNPNDGNCPADGDYSWTFTYPYTITVQGRSSGSEAELVTETGTISYGSSPGTVAQGGLPSFAKWGAFIDNFALCQGALVPGTMSGPFFTNGSWNFGNFSNPGYTFTDSIEQAGSQVGWINGKCTAGNQTPPKGFRAPTFDKGFQTGANQMKPPVNSYNQQQAVIDGMGVAPCSTNPCTNGNQQPPTQAAMSGTLKTVNGTPYPSSGSVPNGVYVPWYTNANGQAVFGSDPSQGGNGAGGGFYVNGNASVALSATAGGDGTSNPTQTYTITQGSTTTTIVVDNVTGTTTMSSGGGTPLTLQGVPTQLDPNTGAPIVQKDPSGNPVDPTLIYVNGQVTGLSGTVQNDTGITVTAASDVNITGDLTYVSQPVNSSDVLNSNTDAGVLGIYTTGNINLNPDSSGNLTVNASLAAIGSGTSGFATPGSAINTWTIVGGRSEDQAHGVKISAGNTLYDQRFAGNFGPPWFPTAVPQAGAPGIPQSQSAIVTRTSWQEISR